MSTKNTVCPRCTGPIPNALHVGEYPGALSRVVDIEICSACGTDEAMRDFTGEAPIPPTDWPIGVSV